MRMLFLGLGFVSYSVASILGGAHEVTVTGRRIPPDHPVKREYFEGLSRMGVRFERLDPLGEPERLREIVRPYEVIVNFIGMISGSEGELMRANYEVPRALVRAIQESNPDAFLIHIGAATLGQREKRVVEESPHGAGLAPRTPYERSKLMAEREVLGAPFRKAVLRPTVIYGRANSHVEFVTIYRLARRGIMPRLDLALPAVNVRYLAEVIGALAEERPTSDYLYVNECGKVGVTRLFELHCRGLGKRCLGIPAPGPLVSAFLPEGLRPLVRYADYEFTCERTREYVGDPTFVEEDVMENARFLRGLDERGELVPERSPCPGLSSYPARGSRQGRIASKPPYEGELRTSSAAIAHGPEM